MDFWLSLVLLGMSALVFTTASGYEDLPSRFPKLLAALFSVLAALLMMSTLLKRKKRPSDIEGVIHRFRGPVLLVLVMVIYVLAVDFVGYVLPSVLLFLFVGWILGYRKYRSLALTGLVAIGITYAVFHLALGVPLPSLPFLVE